MPYDGDAFHFVVFVTTLHNPNNYKESAMVHGLNIPIGNATDGDLKPEDALQLFLEGNRISNPKRLLLINLLQVPERWFDVEVARLCRYHLYPPTGLLYIAAAAQIVKPDLEIRILDLNFEMLRLAQSESFGYDGWKELVARELDGRDSVHVGISCMFNHDLANYFELAEFIDRNYPDVPIIVGGVQSTYEYDRILTSSACDMVVCKEGELQFAAFLESAIAGQPVSIPWGAACKLPDGQVYKFDATNEGPVPVDLDITQCYDLLEGLEDYNKYGSLGTFSRFTGRDMAFCSVISRRGCRARCTFCTVRNFNGVGVRQRSPQDVIDEIKYLWDEKGVRQIDWLDDDLLYDEPRAIELFKGLAEQIPDLTWICNNGLIAGAASDELLEWMVKSGLRAFTIGIESGNSQMLTKVKKPATKSKLREAKKRFDQHPEVLATANFLIGFPDETFKQMLDTFEFALELEMDWARYFICQPLRGTEMFSAFQALSDERIDYRNSEDINPAKSRIDSDFLNPVKTKQIGKALEDVPSAEEDEILSGTDIFTIDPDSVPSQNQLKEIWFTFNLITNFLRNRNLSKSGNPDKIVRWVDSIHSVYPYDASMCAFLAYGYKLLGDTARGEVFDKKFVDILGKSEYWEMRVAQFPELRRMVGRQPDVRVG